MVLLTWITRHPRRPANGGAWLDVLDCLEQARALWATGGCERMQLVYLPRDSRVSYSWVWVAPRRRRRRRG